MDTYELFRPYIDEKYRKFALRITKTEDLPFLGIRMPVIRKLAKGLDDYSFVPRFHEDVHLRGFIIAGLRLPFREKKPIIETQLPYLATWDETDSFAPSLKVRKNEKDEAYEYFLSLLSKEEVYSRRLAIVWIKTHMLGQGKEKEIVDHLAAVKDDDYYISMALAWTLCEIYITDKVLVEKNLHRFKEETVKRTMQKVRDSFRT